jgi:catechol 2,3-dioxygenase-like lactoylglutathione lyase family enzyme
MADPAPRIDFANLPTPAEGLLVTLFITVRKVARSRDFYSRVLGGTVVLDENPCMVKLSNSWIIMNPGGPPHPRQAGYLGGRLPARRHHLDLFELAGR